MSSWFFPSRGHGELEGPANPALEIFKDEPIRAMAREICQNSLDAKRNNDKPVVIEFENIFIKPTQKFPGISDMQNILSKCRAFWKEQKDEKALQFINNADSEIRDLGLFVLRISDYNTTGLKGSFSNEKITPWKSLVQGNAFSVKNTDSAAGSYGIGKAAPFVVSSLQTVFYRTYDEDGVRAAQGVTHLVSFEDKNMALPGEDIVRRSTGYYGNGKENNPYHKIQELDDIYMRNEYGTDLFIPGFTFKSGKLSWQDEITIEILENFLYAIYSGKLEVIIDKNKLNKNTLKSHINRLAIKTKNVAAFYDVICEDNKDVIEEVKKFYQMGSLRLRLLYKPDTNKQILVVRNSGMKIAKIPRLPKGISYTGFLEIQGEKLNTFFRGMENPKHDAWEYKRHIHSQLAKKYKSEVEEWVREMIGKKIKEISGDKLDIDLSEVFYGKEISKEESQIQEKIENIIDTVKDIKVIQEDVEQRKFKVRDIGEKLGNTTKRVKGTIDDKGNQIGSRHPSGKKRRKNDTGRKGFSQENGLDSIYEGQGLREVYVSARIISKGNGINKMIFVAEEDISRGELEVVTLGESGKALKLIVTSAKSSFISVKAVSGHIEICDIKAKEKNILEFSIYGNRNYAMGVKAYEN